MKSFDEFIKSNIPWIVTESYYEVMRSVAKQYSQYVLGCEIARLRKKVQEMRSNAAKHSENEMDIKAIKYYSGQDLICAMVLNELKYP